MIHSILNRRGIALVISFFVLFASFSNWMGAQTIVNNAACFHLVANANQNANCHASHSVDCGDCDQHCATIDMTNTSNNCEIQQLSITPHTTGLCFSICCPNLFGGPPADSLCNNNSPKTFNGSAGPSTEMPPPGIATFTICYYGTGPQTFDLSITGIIDDGPPPANDCCATVSTVQF